MNPTEQAVDAALREARNAALEEAARVCDESSTFLLRALHFSCRIEQVRAYDNAAQSIRALKSQEPPK